MRFASTLGQFHKYEGQSELWVALGCADAVVVSLALLCYGKAISQSGQRSALCSAL